MDEEQDFAYAVSEKALRHIAETPAARYRASLPSAAAAYRSQAVSSVSIWLSVPVMAEICTIWP